VLITHAIGSHQIGSGLIGDPAPFRYRPRAGLKVRYRDATGNVHHAVITAVTNDDTVDLRVGRDLTVAAVPRATERHNNVAGWYRSGKTLVNP
jgi:hypothetical protein